MILSFNIQANSQINFKEVQIDDLTNENCVFLDELDEDTFDDITRAIKARTKEVVNDNLVKQGLSSLVEEEEEVNDNGDNHTVSEPPVSTDENQVSKEDAKQKIISSVSEAMTVAQNEGKTYTLDDLIYLEIPDSTFTVSVDGDFAILNVDGFEFRLDSEFHLYE